MSQINPFTGSILQSPQVQRQQATDKDRQVRRAVEQTKNAALADDRLDHQVESSEGLKPVDDEHHPERRFKRNKRQQGKPTPGDDGPHLDLTA